MADHEGPLVIAPWGQIPTMDASDPRLLIGDFGSARLNELARALGEALALSVEKERGHVDDPMIDSNAFRWLEDEHAPGRLLGRTAEGNFVMDSGKEGSSQWVFSLAECRKASRDRAGQMTVRPLARRLSDGTWDRVGPQLRLNSPIVLQLLSETLR